MCPFRAIRRDGCRAWAWREETYGWNLEMQMRAARAGLRILELPVDHRSAAAADRKSPAIYRGACGRGRIVWTFRAWPSRLR